MVGMAVVIQDLMMKFSVLSTITETSRCAEWYECSTLLRSDGGMIMRSLYVMMPSVIDKLPISLCYDIHQFLDCSCCK